MESPQFMADVPINQAGTHVVIPDHQLLRLIGKGSYGEVWLARNTLGTYRAVKIVHESTFRHKRPFEREFNGVQKFEPVSRSHEGLVDILQVGRNDTAGYFYCVMELADDVRSGQVIDPNDYEPRTLARDIAKHARLPVQDCLRIISEVAAGLGFLHGCGLIHRDIKPSNIVFVKGIPKLVDIGLVAEISEARTYVGTDGYIPPEGPGSVQADIYSLGKVLYEISTGKDRRDYPELPPDLSDPAEEQRLMNLNTLMLKACRSDPAERYETTVELIDDLSTLQSGARVSVRTNGRRLFLRSMRAGAVLFCAGVIGAWFYFHSNTNVPIPAPPGLVGWWRAEDNAEDSAGTNRGILYGVGFAPGKVGQAFNFIPTQHRIRIPDASVFKLTNSMTIEAWVFARNVEGANILGRGNRAQHAFEFGVAAHNQLFFKIRSATDAVPLSAPLPNNQWKHVAATLDGDTGDMKLYVDGDLVARNNTIVRPLGDLPGGYEGGLGIGNLENPDFNFCFDGLIDELSLYSRALSQSEIKAVYRAGSGGKQIAAAARRRPKELPPAGNTPAALPPGIVGWWSGEGNAQDQAGTNHGILTGGASFAPGIVGQAFRFDGINGSVTIPKSADLDLGDQITIEFWMKADVTNAMNLCCQGLIESDFYAVAISRAQSPVAGVNFDISADSGKEFGETADINGGAVISSGEWHHIAAAYDGAHMQLYTDGRPWKKPTAYSGRISRMLPGSFLTFGSEDGRRFCPECAGRYFTGLIDEVSIYNRALTADEIAAIHRAGSAGKVRPALPESAAASR